MFWVGGWQSIEERVSTIKPSLSYMLYVPKQQPTNPAYYAFKNNFKPVLIIFRHLDATIRSCEHNIDMLSPFEVDLVTE